MSALSQYGAVSLDIKKAHEVSNKPARSAVAHSLIHQQEAGEARCLPQAASQKVQLAITSSILINIVLAFAKTYAAFASGSLAVLSSLVDSILDLTSQALFWFSDRYMHTPNENYPAGRRRLEPIAVVVSATLMGMASLEVVQKSVSTLIEGFDGHLPQLDMSILTISVLAVAIVVKLMLWFLCSQIAHVSPSAAALAQDHRNDVFSNTVAVSTSLIAHYHSSLWYFDSIGAIAISIYITLSWVATGKEQVERLVGLQADQDFIDRVRAIADAHHPQLKSDIVRAYHFGNNFLVELEVVLPKDMSVQESHDISLALQIKVEALEEVERAFVHVDYQSRDYDEHKDPTVRHDAAYIHITSRIHENLNRLWMELTVIFDFALRYTMSSLTQSWTLDSSNSDVVEYIQKLLLRLPGHVFVSAGERTDAIKFQVTTNTQAVLDNIQVLASLGSPKLQIVTADSFDIKKFPNSTFLGEVIVPSHIIQELECAGAGACILNAGAHTLDQDLSLKVSGSGTLFASTDDVSLRFVNIENIGSGNVQWNAKFLASQTFDVTSSGSGAISIHSNIEIVPQSLKVKVDGTGSVFFAGSPLNVHTVVSTTNGVGDITYFPRAICGTHNVTIGGSGGVYSGSMKCENTSVTMSGSGRAFVKTTNALYTTGGGDVEYVDVTPNILESEKSFWNRDPVLASKNVFTAFSGYQVPEHILENVGIATVAPTTTFTTLTPSPTDGANASQGSNPLTPAATTADGSSFNVVLYFVGGLLVAIAIVVVLLRRHIANKNKQYTPLK